MSKRGREEERERGRERGRKREGGRERERERGREGRLHLKLLEGLFTSFSQTLQE